MTDITIFQCLPAHKARPTNRIIASLKKLNCRILLDLEDSIKDLIIPANTIILKQNARHNLASIFKSNPDFKFDVRINSPQSDEYKKDMAILQYFSHNIKSIFIPKIECIKDIYEVIKDIGTDIKVNPIFETVKGLKNKEHICIPKLGDIVEFFFYGNYDFHLDADIFPIHEQNTETYWETVETLIKTIEGVHNFGNSPYSNIIDLATLRYSLFRLKSICSKSFAVMSLHKSQTIEYMKLQPCSINRTSNIINTNEQVINKYISGKLKARSFAIDKETKRIITPQEYLLALNNITR